MIQGIIRVLSLTATARISPASPPKSAEAALDLVGKVLMSVSNVVKWERVNRVRFWEEVFGGCSLLPNKQWPFERWYSGLTFCHSVAS